jgi:hypothetical protein
LRIQNAEDACILHSAFCIAEWRLMLPLKEITVVAVEQAVAAPFASRQLADLGARVIKIERPEVGDFARSYDTTVRGMASHFVWINDRRSRRRVSPQPCARRHRPPWFRLHDAARAAPAARDL